MVIMLAGWADVINDAARRAPSSAVSMPETQALSRARDDGLAALGDVIAAQEAIPLIMANQELTGTARFNRAGGGHDAAINQARATLSNLQVIADALHKRLVSAWMPPKPSGVSDLALYDRKHDVQQLLLMAEDDPRLIVCLAATLLQNAQADGSADSKLTSYIVAAPPLALFYQAHGGTHDMPAAQFATV